MIQLDLFADPGPAAKPSTQSAPEPHRHPRHVFNPEDAERMPLDELNDRRVIVSGLLDALDHTSIDTTKLQASYLAELGYIQRRIWTLEHPAREQFAPCPPRQFAHNLPRPN